MRKLYECHCHIALDGDDFKVSVARHKNGADICLIRENLQKYREAGVTYLRDGGDKWGASAAAKKYACEYEIEYVSPVFPIHKKGNYGGFIGRSFETMGDFRELVREVKAGGGDFIKIMASGIMDFGEFGKLTGWILSADELREIVNISHGEGFAVMAHTNGAEGVKQCIDAGVDSVEHGNYMDGEAVKYLAESGCLWVPTVTATTGLLGKGIFPEDMLEKILEMQKCNIALGAQLGAMIASGSDAGAKCVPHGEGIICETKFLTEFVSEENLEKAQEKLKQTFKYKG